MFEAFHVVTGRPVGLGQSIGFDERNRSGVWRRVREREAEVERIYADPRAFDGQELDHHLAVAFRELALEEVNRPGRGQPARCRAARRLLTPRSQGGDSIVRQLCGR